MAKDCDKTDEESEAEDGADRAGCQDRSDGYERTQSRHERHENIAVSDGQETWHRRDETYKTDRQATRDE